MKKHKYFISKQSRSINWQWPIHSAAPRVIKQFIYQQTFRTFKIFFISKSKIMSSNILGSIKKYRKKNTKNKDLSPAPDVELLNTLNKFLLSRSNL